MRPWQRISSEPLRQQAGRLYDIGQRVLYQGHWENAERLFRLTVDLNPEHLPARLKLVESLLALGKTKEALQQAEYAMGLDAELAAPLMVRALVEHARSLLDANPTEDNLPLAACERALALNPTHEGAQNLRSQVWRRRAELSLRQDDFTAALAAYRMAGDQEQAKRVSKMAFWQFLAQNERRAQEFMEDGQWQQAAELLKTMLHQSPNHESRAAWQSMYDHCQRQMALAQVFDAAWRAFQQAHWQQAAVYLRQVVAVQPDYYRLGYWAIELLRQAERADSALALHPQAAAVQPHSAISAHQVEHLHAIARLGGGQAMQVTYTPDGSTLILATSVGLIIFDAQTLQEKRWLESSAWLWSVHVSADSQTAVTGTGSGQLQIWRLSDGSLLREISGHEQIVRCVAFSPRGDLLASADEDGRVCLWRVADGVLLRTLEGSLGSVRSLSFSPDGRFLALAPLNKTVRIRQVSDGALVQVLSGHKSSVSSLAYAPDGNLLASASEDGSIFLWNPRTGDSVANFRIYTGVVSRVVFSADGSKLFSGAWDGSLRMWDVASQRLLQTFDDRAGPVADFALSPDNRTLAAISVDERTMRLWDIASTEIAQSLSGLTGAIYDVAFSPDGDWLACGDADRAVHLVNVHQKSWQNTLRFHRRPVRAVAYHPNGRWLASGSEDGAIALWDVRESRLLASFANQPPHAVRALAFVPDGSALISAADDGLLRLWAISGDETPRIGEPQVLKGHRHTVYRVQISPDGRWLASADGAGIARLWNLENPQQYYTLNANVGALRDLAFSPDGETLAVVTQEFRIVLWSVKTQELLHSLPTGQIALRSIAFSPDNSLLVCGAQNGFAYFWDVQTRQCVREMRMHTHCIWRLAFSSDGQTLASASEDGTLRFWAV
ncbi:MAG: hypothetical protein OHK0052_08460 [Anaerolineales bacterium]